MHFSVQSNHLHLIVEADDAEVGPEVEQFSELHLGDGRPLIAGPDSRGETQELFIPPGPRLGDVVVRAENVSKSFGDKLLFGSHAPFSMLLSTATVMSASG